MSSGALWGTSFGALASSRLAVYEEILVPRMFEPWARSLVQALEIVPGQAVVDVACGPGSVARVAAAAAGSTGRVVGYDFSPTMIELARSKPPVAGGAPIDYQEAPAEHLPAQDGEFDVATCQQGLQFFRDRPAALREVHRVLRTGGRAGITVWSAIEHSPPFRALADAVQHVLGAAPANGYRAGPFGLPDPEELRGLLSGAGFHEVSVSTETLEVTFEGGAEQVLATLAVTPLADEIEHLPDDKREALLATIARDAGEGPISSTLQANVAVARR